MACLRSMWRRRTTLSSRQCSLPFHVFHYNKDDVKPDSPGSHRLLCKSFSCLLQSQVHSLDSLWYERKHVPFARQVGSGFWLRYMSSRPEEGSYTFEGLRSVIEELVPEKTVEAVAMQVSVMNEVAAAAADTYFPANCVQYLIGGVHEYTGLNWWASIVLTAFLFNGPSFPIFISRLNRIEDFLVLHKRIQQIRKKRKEIAIYDLKALAYNLMEEKYLKKKCAAPMSSLTMSILLDAFIYVSFIYGISNMARKIPSFKSGGILWFSDLSVPDSLYILPLVTGLTFWFSAEVFQRQRKLVARTRRLLWWIFGSVLLQSTFEFNAAVLCFMIPSKLSTLILLLVIRSRKIIKFRNLRHLLGLPGAVAPQPGSPSRSASENNTPVAESVLSELSKISKRILSLKSDMKKMKDNK